MEQLTGWCGDVDNSKSEIGIRKKRRKKRFSLHSRRVKPSGRHQAILRRKRQSGLLVRSHRRLGPDRYLPPGETFTHERYQPGTALTHRVANPSTPLLIIIHGTNILRHLWAATSIASFHYPFWFALYGWGAGAGSGGGGGCFLPSVACFGCKRRHHDVFRPASNYAWRVSPRGFRFLAETGNIVALSYASSEAVREVCLRPMLGHRSGEFPGSTPAVGGDMPVVPP